jgi:hypothetical protein
VVAGTVFTNCNVSGCAGSGWRCRRELHLLGLASFFRHPMTTNLDDRAGPPQGSFAGFMLGVRFALPVLPGMVAFGLATGATAARQGFSFVDSLLMNLFVYAGMSQLVAMEVWPQRLTTAALGALALLCATINARMLLITASLQPWLGGLPPWKIVSLRRGPPFQIASFRRV